MKYILCSFLLAYAAVGQTPPQGWSGTQKGNAFEMQPGDLPTKRLFVYSLYPEETSTVSLARWLEAEAKKDAPQQGQVVASFDQRDMGAVKTITTGTTKGGKTQLIVYMAVEKENQKQLARVITDPDVNFFKPYLSTALKHFLKTTGTRIKAGSVREPVARTKKPRPSRPATPLTAPGKGLTHAQIQGVYMHSEMRYGVGGFMYQEYEPYVLLKDGTLYKNITVSPYDLDVPASRKVEANKWGTWQKNGSKMNIRWSDGKTDSWDKWHLGQPARRNETITGSFKTISGGGDIAMGGSTMIVSSKNITFSPDGKFTYESMGGGSSSSSGVGVSAYSNQDKAGNYQLDGYTLTLKFNNGLEERRFFYFYPDSRRHFGIGSSVYVPQKK
ncbi:hypothetical protein [Tellurirhabdus bombi]|uniref:hypothetical protein n=1 Tax=Tellurirhabdus bombi TaxID=2907205 RepID=UPI001F30D31A|nr:hypothetical protein [Tellurirhabdus bombi]